MAREDTLTEIDRAVGALQDPTRRRILLDFYAHDAEATAEEVANAVGVHRTVAHDHLERLVALGYLTVGRRRHRHGRPAKLYRLAGRLIDVTYPVRRFARLAALLAEGLRDVGPAGTAAARDAGRRYGASLVTGPARSVRGVLAQLAPLGADYEVDGDRVIARNCIFREVCAASDGIVCDLHAGVLEGAFDRAGVPLRAEALRSFETYGCAYLVVAA